MFFLRTFGTSFKNWLVNRFIIHQLIILVNRKIYYKFVFILMIRSRQIVFISPSECYNTSNSTQRRNSAVRTQSLVYKLGVKIRILRKAAGLTQEQLAEAADVSVNFMGYVERGQRAPSIQTLERIAQALNVAPKALFDFSEDEGRELLCETLLAEARKCTPDDLRALIQVAKQLGNKSL
jgi:transcriptional regulator with XRE-family HTH domain